MSTAVISRLLSSEHVAKKCVQLNNGIWMPIVGFGTYKINDYDVIYSCLDTALQAGYRLIDTATIYGNEEAIGTALEKLLPKHHLKREEIFITSKLAFTDHGDYDVVSKSVQQSLKKLKTPYIDLYLIHWPGTQQNPKGGELKLRTTSYAALSRIYKEDKTVRAIGVSNYTARQLNLLLQEPNVVVPVLNQVEFHPYWQQSDEFHEVCNKANIITQAYFSLGGTANENLRVDPDVAAAAKENNVTSAQVLLRWALQRGYAIIPKSVTPERIQSNIELNFSLSEKSVKAISDIKIKMTKKFSWDPEIIP